MELSPGYKLTEAGVIPDNWKYLPIAEVARLESGHTPSKRVAAYWNGNVPWVSLHDTEALERAEIHTTAKTISEAGLRNSSARLLPAGTVVFSRTATVGKASIMSRPMATSQDFANYICGPTLHNGYLIYLLRGMKSIWRQLMAGSIHNTIYMPAFEALKIVCPPLDEQRAIAETLLDVESLLDGLVRLIAKKRDIKQAAAHQLLTGQTRLSGFHAVWKRTCIDGVASRTAGFWGRAQRDDSHTRAVRVIRAGDIDSDGRLTGFADRFFSDAEASKAHCGIDDVIITGSGSVGKVWWCDGRSDMAASNFVRILRPAKEELNGRFLAQLLRSDPVQRVMHGHITSGVLANLGRSFFTSPWMKLPPLDEQSSIASILADMDAELEALEARLEKTKALKQAMMQELLTGRTRLAAPEHAHA